MLSLKGSIQAHERRLDFQYKQTDSISYAISRFPKQMEKKNPKYDFTGSGKALIKTIGWIIYS